MMARCIEVSKTASREGEFPFACVISHGEEVLVETVNRVVRDKDLTHHAELVAVSQAYRMRDRVKLKDCTLYANVEPCPMCSFAIRESGIGRVVFSLRSPLMGGHSRWDILQDAGLSRRMPEVFGRAPEVVTAVQAKEAARAWRRWNPVIWGVIRLRGIFGGR
ncbi:MAG: nucleoside deaminase [Variibacter sp.]|nr:nucleoside deaminase [Variibacter sp.]